MALSDIQICNMALSRAGARSNIESLNEASVEARECKTWYNPSLEQALESFDWNFARTRAVASLHAEDPPDGIWAFRYTYPSDCIVMREIENKLGPDADAHPFEIEADSTGYRSILTNVEDATLIYTKRQTNANVFTPFFVTYLSWVLAANIAYAITGKQSNVERALNSVVQMQIMAPAMNANERVGRPPRDADWIRARQNTSRVSDAPITRSS